MGAERTIAPSASAESTVHLFAGAKEVRVLDAYEKTLNVPHFDLAVDFGLYYFLTKPFFFILSLIGHMTGNFGIAIVIFTFILRAAMYPPQQHLLPLLRQDEEDRAGDECAA